MRQFWAKINLLWHGILHFIKKPFVRRRGLPSFYKNYSADGVTPISRTDRLILQASNTCINCGLCIQDLNPSSEFYITFHAPSSMAICFARVMVIDDEFSKVPNIFECEQHCPVRVPLRRLQQTLQNLHRKEVKGA